MRLYLKKILIIIAIIVLLILCFFFTDFLLVKNLKQPIFCKISKQYWDGGSYECYGIFYKVNVYKNIHGEIEYEEIGTYNLKFDKSKVSFMNN